MENLFRILLLHILNIDSTLVRSQNCLALVRPIPDDFHSGTSRVFGYYPRFTVTHLLSRKHLMPSCRVGRQDQNPLDNHSVSRKRQNKRQLSGPTPTTTGLRKPW